MKFGCNLGLVAPIGVNDQGYNSHMITCPYRIKGAGNPHPHGHHPHMHPRTVFVLM